MTQIELETRLSEIEANYASRISDHHAEILNQKIHIEKLHAEHDMAVSKAKQQILNQESMISSLKAIKLEKKQRSTNNSQRNRTKPCKNSIISTLAVRCAF